MKKLLLLLVLLPFSAIAQLHFSAVVQKWDIGLHAGVSVITDPKDWQIASTRILPSPAFMVTMGRRINPRLRLGLDVAATKLWRKADVPLYDLHGSMLGTRINGRLCIGDLAFMISPSISYTVNRVFFGGQLGYVALTKGDYFRYADDNGKLYRNFNSGFFGGLHAGYVRKLGKAVDLQVELRGNFVQVNDRTGGVLWNRAQMAQAQATVGLHYHF